MITLEKPYSVRKSGIENDGISFGIKKDGLAHIFNVLRNQLYSNKILAVIREYSCNAYDAQVEAGNSDQKFVVTCPTLDDPCFKVRDFGHGLSPEEIAEVYAFYGESTKRNSNALIGQLGLGSKSGFAYGDNFVIRSFHNGTLYTYNAFLDETKIGQIVKMREEFTSEKNGVEIVVPVRVRDISSFKENIGSFFKYFSSKPQIVNIEKDYLDNCWRADEKILHGEGWQFLKSRNSWDKTPSMMIMGNVAYPLHGASVDNLPSIYHTDFIVEFNIGELEVSASREALQFSTSTQNAIRRRFQIIKSEIDFKIKEKIANAKSLFEAKCIYHSFTAAHGDFYRFQKQLTNITWNKKNVDNNQIITPPQSKNVRIFEIVKSRRSDRIISRILESKVIRCYSGCLLYVDDTKQKFMQRLAHYVFNEKQTGISVVYVIQFADNQSKQDWLKGVDMAESEIPLASSEKINKIVYPKNANGSSPSIKDAKHISCEFKLNRQATNSFYKAKSEQFFETSFDLNAGGVYLYINRFHCKKNYCDGDLECHIEPTNFIRLFNNSQKGFEIVYPEIACLKKDTAEKAIKNKKWQSLEEYIKQYISDNWKNNQCQKIANYLELQKFLKDYKIQWQFLVWLKYIPDIVAFQNVVKSFYLIESNGTLDKDASDNFISLFDRTNLKDVICGGKTSTHNLKNEIEKIFNKYEIFNTIDWYDGKNPRIVQKYLDLEEKNLTSAQNRP